MKMTERTIQLRSSNTIFKTSKYILLIFLGIALINCRNNPENVWVQQPGLYPEGLERHPGKNQFLVTSLTKGSVGLVNDQGEYSPFIEDERLVSAIGIRVDKKQSRVIVANSDPGVSIRTSAQTKLKLAAVGIYDLKDGSPIAYYELDKLYKGNHFANDIALDKDGNIYITDSFSPVIYKIDGAGKESIFFTNERFTGKGFNLNGIVAVNNYLIVAKYNEGVLFKIPLENPENFKQIKIDRTFPGADGLAIAKDGSLALIANGSISTVFKLESDDDFVSAKIVATDHYKWRYNTTGIFRCNDFYVLNAELNALFGGKDPVQKFEIRKVKYTSK
ncbi:MAG: hypothetical protein ABUK01_09655 [Leptospirales bacterium]